MMTTINKSILGDCRDVMRQLIDEGIKVKTCITSPPYYGLRDYGTANWEGGDKNCDHQTSRSRGDDIKVGDKQGSSLGSRPNTQKLCKCGAVRIDKQIGLEETPEEYINSMVEVFRCLWDLLDDDGTLWLNIGDSYYNYRPGKGQVMSKQTLSKTNQDLPTNNAKRGNKLLGLKEKDLIGIPWMLAFALRADGWYLRQDIIWNKPNPMPESVQDRCTKSHEYVFLLTKSSHYYYDNEAIKELATSTDATNRDRDLTKLNNTPGRTRMAGLKTNHYETKNKRSVWNIPTKSSSDAHFAVMPEELVEPCILAGSKVGDIVFDPFMGSGTVGRVAQALGRKWLGAELNPEYIKIQDKRTAQQSMEFV